MSKASITEEFASLLFTEETMQTRLPQPTYQQLMEVIRDGKPLDQDIANEVAHAMKEWALELGATHYAHWFQPLTGITSEKHDGFLNINEAGKPLLSFSGKELIQGESDASSFPSGGLRATFEARGYTAWDPTSPAFIKDEVLCIPTAFISYQGHALDQKTPLLRSQVALESQVKRVLKWFGKKPHRVLTTVGPEQEYFLINEEDFSARPDLVYCGRTLFGCPPVKGQELDEHYFGAIRPTVNEFMKELDDELWKLGVPARTKHNEVAPSQHELAPIFEIGSRAIDDNLLTMEKLKLMATRHGLACLEHEKPFAYVNGSGKHNNWSLAADGKNLLEPGEVPAENLQFLVFLACLVAAVDTRAPLLRASVASAGNDHRLGGNEAPPAIISVFLGDDLSELVEQLISDEGTYVAHHSTRMDLGVPALADVVRDTTDRNRTSPFAFTGNKFEFRMCGSQQNLSEPNIVLNTAVAEQCDLFATYMEAHASEGAVTDIALQWVKDTFRAHQRIIFEGNGYTEAWEQEAAARGLLNLRSTPETLPYLMNDETIQFFETYKVLSAEELKARYISKAEQYAKLINIEANTMVYMAYHLYIPAISRYSKELAEAASVKRSIGVDTSCEAQLCERLSTGLASVLNLTQTLENVHAEAESIEDVQLRCEHYRDFILPAMGALRTQVDALECITDADKWPVPSYNRLLFWV